MKLKKITLSQINKTIVLSILSAFCYTTLAAPYAEASIWAERRKAVEDLNNKGTTSPRTPDSTLLAQLPSVNPGLLPRLASGMSDMTSVSNDFSSLSIASKIPITKLKLPLAYSNFKSADFPKSWKPQDLTVIHIQDVHMNFEAQSNISKSIQELINQGKVDFVALEGAFKDVDISGFRDFKDQDSVRVVADYFLKEDKISGALHTALTNAKTIPPFVGVDDKAFHTAHINAYKESVNKVEGLKKELIKEQSKLDQSKVSVFNKDLKGLDHKIQAYREGKIQIGEYVKSLTPASNSQTPNTAIFLKALQMEQSLDFTKVEAERAKLIQALVHKLSKSQVSHLMNVSLAYRIGKVRHMDFYVYLKKLCKTEEIDLKNYPTMDKYVQYVILSDQINAEKFLKEVRDLEVSSVKKLARTEMEIRLMAESRQLYLRSKLLSFALTPEEWAEYKAGVRGAEGKEIESFKSFFEHAALRDQAMTDNLLKAVKERNAKTVVLVTGGYHTGGMTQLLTSPSLLANDPSLPVRPAAVITLSPKITKLEGTKGTEYLSVFTQEKTPLEKLFDGDKLFVAALVASLSKRSEIAQYILARIEALNGLNIGIPASVEERQHNSMAGESGVAVSIEDWKREREVISVATRANGDSRSLSLRWNNDGSVPHVRSSEVNRSGWKSLTSRLPSLSKVAAGLAGFIIVGGVTGAILGAQELVPIGQPLQSITASVFAMEGMSESIVKVLIILLAEIGLAVVFLKFLRRRQVTHTAVGDKDAEQPQDTRFDMFLDDMSSRSLVPAMFETIFFSAVIAVVVFFLPAGITILLFGAEIGVGPLLAAITIAALGADLVLNKSETKEWQLSLLDIAIVLLPGILSFGFVFSYAPEASVFTKLFVSSIIGYLILVFMDILHIFYLYGKPPPNTTIQSVRSIDTLDMATAAGHVLSAGDELTVENVILRMPHNDTEQAELVQQFRGNLAQHARPLLKFGRENTKHLREKTSIFMLTIDLFSAETINPGHRAYVIDSSGADAIYLFISRPARTHGSIFLRYSETGISFVEEATLKEEWSENPPRFYGPILEVDDVRRAKRDEAAEEDALTMDRTYKAAQYFYPIHLFYSWLLQKPILPLKQWTQQKFSPYWEFIPLTLAAYFHGYRTRFVEERHQGDAKQAERRYGGVEEIREAMYEGAKTGAAVGLTAIAIVWTVLSTAGDISLIAFSIFTLGAFFAPIIAWMSWANVEGHRDYNVGSAWATLTSGNPADENDDPSLSIDKAEVTNLSILQTVIGSTRRLGGNQRKKLRKWVYGSDRTLSANTLNIVSGMVTNPEEYEELNKQHNLVPNRSTNSALRQAGISAIGILAIGHTPSAWLKHSQQLKEPYNRLVQLVLNQYSAATGNDRRVIILALGAIARSHWVRMMLLDSDIEENIKDTLMAARSSDEEIQVRISAITNLGYLTHYPDVLSGLDDFMKDEQKAIRDKVEAALRTASRLPSLPQPKDRALDDAKILHNVVPLTAEAVFGVSPKLSKKLESALPIEVAILASLALRLDALQLFLVLELFIVFIHATFVFIKAQRKAKEEGIAPQSYWQMLQTYGQLLWKMQKQLFFASPYFLLTIGFIRSDLILAMAATGFAVWAHLAFDGWFKRLFFNSEETVSEVDRTVQDDDYYYDRGREFLDEQLSEESHAAFMNIVLGSVQGGVGLQEGLHPNSAFRSNQTLAQLASEEAVIIPFITFIGRIVETPLSINSAQDMRKLAHLSTLLGLSESMTVEINELVARRPVTQQTREGIRKAREQGSRDVANMLSDSAFTPVYFNRDLVLGSQEVATVYFNSTELSRVNGQLTSEAIGALSHAAEVAKRVAESKGSQWRVPIFFTVRLESGDERSPEEIQDALTAQLVSASQELKMPGAPFSEVKVAIHKSNVPLTRQMLINGAVKALELDTKVAYSLSLFSTTGVGLTAELQRTLNWIISGTQAAHMSKFIMDLGKRARMLAIQA